MSVRLAAFLLLTIFALVAAASDWKLRRIPNWLTLALAVCGLALTLFQDGAWLAAGHTLHMIIALAVGMLLFALRAIGGGDAKYYAAVAAWFPLRDGAALLVDTSLAGLVLFVCWVAVRRLMGLPFRIKDPAAFDKFPYGVAIGAGAVLTYWWQSLA